MAMNSHERSPLDRAGDDDPLLRSAATALHQHTDQRWVEVSGDILVRILSMSRPSHPLQAMSQDGSYQVSELVLVMSLQRALDVIPHSEVTHIRIKAERDRYQAVAIVITVEYPFPIIPIADRIRDVSVRVLEQILGASPEINVSGMHVHVGDVTRGDPKLG